MEIETEQQFEVHETEQQQAIEVPPVGSVWSHEVQVVVQEHQEVEELHEASGQLSPRPEVQASADLDINSEVEVKPRLPIDVNSFKQTLDASGGWPHQVQIVVQGHDEEPPPVGLGEACSNITDNVNSCNGAVDVKPRPISASSGPTFKCSKCKRKFRNPHLLQQHLRLHRTTAPTTYKCSECEEAFPDLERFMKHREICTHIKRKKKRENVPIGLFDGQRQGEEPQVGEGVQNIGLTPSASLMNALCSALTGQADGSGQGHPATANVKPGGSDGIQIELPTQVKAIYFNTQSPNLNELMNFMLLLNCKMDAIIKHFNVPISIQLPNIEITTVKTQPEEVTQPEAAATPTTPTSSATVTAPSTIHVPTSKEQQQQDYYASTLLQSGTSSTKQWLAALSPYSGIIQQHGVDQMALLQSPLVLSAQNTSVPYTIPEATVEKVFLESRSRGNFAKNLTFQVFTAEERRSRNCTGRVFGRAVPKGQLDAVKVNAIKEAIFRKYPCHPSLVDITWKKECVTAIDSGLRNETRTRKLKIATNIDQKPCY